MILFSKGITAYMKKQEYQYNISGIRITHPEEHFGRRSDEIHSVQEMSSFWWKNPKQINLSATFDYPFVSWNQPCYMDYSLKRNSGIKLLHKS